jgi:FkbM family methyltransferase
MFIKSKIREYLARKFDVPSIPFALERLASKGWKPSRIFDVGAYQGDFAQSCLKVWHNCEIACFEVLEHRVNQLDQLASRHGSIQVFPMLLGAENRDKVILHQAETASSILMEHIPQNFPVASYPMQTVDHIVQKHFNGHSPDFLKLDVQGYELEVLKGAEQSLSTMQVILAEVNLLDIHQGVPLLADITTWLSDLNWVAYDICGLTRRPSDRALWQADMLFVPENSPLRSDKRWRV